MMFNYAIAFLALMSMFNAQTTGSSGTNFSPDLPPSKGNCSNIPAYELTSNKSMYEGRWYGDVTGMVPAQANRVSCLYFDSFFDKNESLHDYFNILQDGKLQTVISVGTVIDENLGTYAFNNGLNATLYYVDDKLIVRLTIRCVNNVPYRGLVVAYRDLKYIPEKANLVAKLLKALEESNGLNQKAKISHCNCTYPPPMKNPYE